MADATTPIRAVLILAAVMAQVPFAGTVQTQSAQQPKPQDDDKLVRYVFEGMKAARNKLRSGACEITGKDETGDFKMTYHFEGVKVRCDRVGRIIRGNDGFVDNTMFFATNGKTAYSYQSSSRFKGVIVYKASEFPNGEGLGFWDLRTAGLGLYLSSAKQSFDQALSYYESILLGKTKVSRQGSIWTLTTFRQDESPEDGWLTTVILDEARGYTVSSKVAARVDKKGRPDEKKILRFTYATKWSEIDGVWVPASEKATDGKGKELYRFTYKWLSVNKPLDPDILHYKSFPLPADTPVMDFSQGRYGRLIAGRDPNAKTPSTHRPRAAYSRTRLVSFLIGVVLALIGMMLVVMRVRNRWRGDVNPSSNPPPADTNTESR